jgi:integrase
LCVNSIGEGIYLVIHLYGLVFKSHQELNLIHRRIEKLPRVQLFLSSKERGTVYRNLGYKTALAYLHRFLNAKHSSLTLDTIIDTIGSGNIDVYNFLDEFVAYLSQTKNLSHASIHQYLTSVKSYLQYHDVDIIPYKFKKRVTLPKIPREEELAIDQNDIRTILQQCHNRRLKTYLLVLASSGVRATEACAIRLRDISFNESPTKIHIRPEYTKTKRSRDIYISDEARDYLKNWIEYKFGVMLNGTEKNDRQIDESLVFQVHEVKVREVTPKSIYNRIVRQFHNILENAHFDERKDGMPRRRRITLHSFRRYVKTTISDSPAGRDYSEWILGHNKSSYYVSKPAVRAEIYKTKCMIYLTFLEYSTLEANGKSLEARINEIEKEKQIMSQKHEQEMQELREQTDRKLNEIILMIQKNPKLARLKREVLMTKPLNRK